MTLLITIFAAVVTTLIWYSSEKARKLNVIMPVFMFWGASLMWLVDAVVEFIEIRAEYFTPAAADMLNDAFLGVSVIALAMVIWIVSVLIKDPNGVFTKRLKKN